MAAPRHRDGPNIARIAALVGEPARAEMLTALLGGQALTASELADVAGVTKATASAHLARLGEARLVDVEAQGRHRYFRLADEDVARLLEGLMGVAQRAGSVRLRGSPRDPALRHARVCYDHIAGDVGVGVLDALLRDGLLRAEGRALEVTSSGSAWFRDLGIDIDKLPRARRPLCRPCIDWSVRRHHLGGALGAALLQRAITAGWVRRLPDSRVLRLSGAGQRVLRERFGVAVG